MKISNFRRCSLFISAFLFLGPLPVANADETVRANQDADNTKTNRDNYSSEKTSDHQSLNSRDTETSRQIREKIFKDEVLSTYAHNVKIITTNGKVILKGPVRSQAEKSQIEKYAKSIAGPSHVVNELVIAPKDRD